MCEANAYLAKDGHEDLVLESVDVIEDRGDRVLITNIFGERRELRAKVRSMSLVNHRIVLEELGGAG